MYYNHIPCAMVILHVLWLRQCMCCCIITKNPNTNTSNIALTHVLCGIGLVLQTLWLAATRIPRTSVRSYCNARFVSKLSGATTTRNGVHGESPQLWPTKITSLETLRRSKFVCFAQSKNLRHSSSFIWSLKSLRSGSRFNVLVVWPNTPRPFPNNTRSLTQRDPN